MTKKTLEGIFQNNQAKPDSALTDKVFWKINKLEKRQNIFNISSLSILLLGSTATLVPVFKSLLENFSKSGFYEYFSLIFSDGKSVLSYWREFSMLLAESLPITSIALTLILILASVIALRYLSRQINKRNLLLSAFS